MRQGDAVIYITDMIYVANMIIAEKLFMSDNEDM